MLPNYQARSPFVLKHTTSLFVYMFGRMYVILYFNPRVFVLVMWSTPSQIALNRILWFIDQYTRITLEIELFTVLNSFAGAVKTWKLKAGPEEPVGQVGQMPDQYLVSS